MRRRIGKAVAVAAAAVCMFCSVGRTVSEDMSSSGMAVKEKREEADNGEVLEIEVDNNLIYYASDDKVWENSIFRAFLEGETAAYDRHQAENLIWPEYFRQHMEYYSGLLGGMQLAAEDLDGDGKEELMVILDDNHNYLLDGIHRQSTDLYVFHEEDGKLYAWDKIENFVTTEGGLAILREGGIFEYFETNGDHSIDLCTWKFNEDGEMEYIWRHCDHEEVESFTGEDGMGYIRFKESMYLYEDGECIRELSNIWQMSEGQYWSEAELVEGDEEFDEVYSALIDALPEEIGKFFFPKWADNAVKIPIWEIPGGQGWASLEDSSKNYREFEYIGETFTPPPVEDSVEDPVEESEDNNLIYYVSDDKVWENDIFRAFLEGEATAYDRHQADDLTWPEYFRICLEENHGGLYGMQLAAEDLDGDGAEELILMLGGKYLYDLYVFHEDAGRLYAWDIVENFNLGGAPWKLREGGVFEYFGQDRLLWRFNETGEQEYIWTFSHDVNQFDGEDGKEYIRYEESLHLFEDGECVRELGYVLLGLASEDLDEAELVEGNEEEFDEVYSALTAALSEEFQYFLPLEHMDNAVEIPIWEAPGGRGWVSVVDLQRFEYVGEDLN